MGAFAIKDSTGRIIDIGLDEADLKRQWHPSYRCVPVHVTEGWIPVSERLPDDGQDVAFIVDCPSQDYLHGRRLGGRFTAGSVGGRFSTPGMSVEASAWMPLPPPPKEPK